VNTSDLRVGKLYLYREKPRPGEPILKVKVTDIVGRRGHVKVRFEDGPHPGLEEYVRTRQLIVPWVERRAFLRDEERLKAVKAHQRRHPTDGAVVTAIEISLDSAGEPTIWLGAVGLSAPEAALERLMDRAGLSGEPVDLHALGFKDRFGDVHLPTATAETIARAFAAAEPETVLLHLEAEESELKAKGYEPGDRFYHQYLGEQRPGYALVRQWAGFENELDNLRQELGRLRGLVLRAVSELDQAGAERAASRLRRALDGR
jgi:hypothetical protein